MTDEKNQQGPHKRKGRKRFGVNCFFQRITGLVLVVFLLVFLEGLYFAWILNTSRLPARSDAILVFMGTEKRTETAYHLANKGLAPFLVLSPANDRFKQRRDKKYNLKTGVTHITEDQAATTFENALYTSRIITDHQLKNVTLVTSDYHMPRSFALLSLFLAGKEVNIQRCVVNADTQRNKSTLMKLVYNEMVEFWGSLFEYAIYQVTGKTSEAPKNKGHFVAFLRSLFILDVTPSW